MTEFKYTNHLAAEKSPYLQQHAHNPVDWYPWGKEAFERAKSEDKPIFLSIGYSTCHWCHVMERESFESEEVARVLNEVFVCIKVDREELPEIDSLYMELSQALMAAAGGWPLNVILTPDLKPFFAVTYLPAKTRGGLIGLIEFAKQIQMLWDSPERTQIVEQASKVVELFAEGAPQKESQVPSEELLDLCIEELFVLVDPVFGGLKGEPKFPMSYMCDFLLAYSTLHSDSRALFFVDLTLDRMHRGGIYDHVGGGFSRYAIDAEWMIPHFEKTLVDNALLAKSYLQAFCARKEEIYSKVCLKICDYMLNRLHHSEGGFYSAEDADLKGKEGFYYTWTEIELSDLLEGREFELFCAYFGVSGVGNFDGRCVLHAAHPMAEFAEALSLPLEEVEALLEGALGKLKSKREERPPPFVDEKIVCSSNGFAIAALALAGCAFNQAHYLNAAQNALSFIQMNHWKEGRLFRRFCQGEVGFLAGLDDYASVIAASLTLFETGLGTEYLRWAIELADLVEREFKEKGGAFFQTSVEEEILLRKCDFYDGAEPSANAVHAENLLRLYQMSRAPKYLQQAEDIFKASMQFVQMFPPGACYHLLALQRYYDPKAPLFVVCLGESGMREEELRFLFFSSYVPHASIVWKRTEDPLFSKLLPAHADKEPLGAKTAIYVCTEEGCEAPLTELDALAKRIATR